MHSALFTFSGTGNTLLVASMLCDAFKSFRVQTDSYHVEVLMKQGSIPDIADADLIGIGYPVYAFNTPKIVHDFVKLLPPGENKRVFIFKTAGEPSYWNNTSSELIIKHLKCKGYNVVFERHFLMPYNIIMRYPEALIKQMVFNNKKLCLDMAKRIVNGEVSLPCFKFKSRIASFIFRVQWPGAALNGRLYGIRKSCNHCLTCFKNCPVNNITVKKGKLKFGWKCIMCMRCIMYCPKNAIRFGLMPFWAVNKPYNFDTIMHDPKIPYVFVNEKTRNYFKLFRKYFRWANEITKDIHDI